MTKATQNKIKEIRERLGLNQKEFANKIGISTGYLSALESNKRQPGRKIFEGIIKECVEELVAVYRGKPVRESTQSPMVAEPGPEWKRTGSSLVLNRHEEALIRALRFLGADYPKDLYYTVMSQARNAIRNRKLEKGELEELREVLHILGRAAID